MASAAAVRDGMGGDLSGNEAAVGGAQPSTVY
ncbi:hypothetical protein RAM_16755 [Amycolatopsis mediterranei S699]|uniref:Uncharacterized protein n=1 Tax=Amycolatopsis mediterranei (strain S699) TaxID=713604 RepID=A0A9R0NWB0_AMYMS|nr:hypothetical protein RAM_16755 [Amycolatopsis mediterranei S699]